MANYEVFCINSYVASENFKVLKPDYYHIADPAHFLDFSARRHSPAEKDRARIDHTLIRELDCPLFVPINRLQSFSGSNIYPIAHISNKYRAGRGSLFSATGHSTMTAYTALHIAVYMGF